MRSCSVYTDGIWSGKHFTRYLGLDEVMTGGVSLMVLMVLCEEEISEIIAFNFSTHGTLNHVMRKHEVLQHMSAP